MLLGIDFDNTIIKYDELFYRISREENLIPAGFARKKIEIRDYLRSKNLEDEWTRIQGEVYGRRINEAVPFDHMFNALMRLKREGVRMRLISHKTKIPYLGRPYDMHQAAMGWLKAQGFFDRNKLNWSIKDIHFELTKPDKIKRIVQEGCTHYVDDLPEILLMLPSNIEKILFSPASDETASKEWKTISSWADIPAKL